jgi:hypothetical protein
MHCTSGSPSWRATALPRGSPVEGQDAACTMCHQQMHCLPAHGIAVHCNDWQCEYTDEAWHCGNRMAGSRVDPTWLELATLAVPLLLRNGATLCRRARQRNSSAAWPKPCVVPAIACSMSVIA